MTATAPVLHVVDDDASFRTAIGRLLRAYGYEVVLYQSGDEFLENPRRKEPGCILLDIRMPGLSGLELQDQLRKMDSILPIVFLTGHGDIPTSVRAIKAGAEDLLSKRRRCCWRRSNARLRATASGAQNMTGWTLCDHWFWP